MARGAYAYLRKSSVRDPARDVSHEVQEVAVRSMAKRYGDDETLVVLSDWDKSGRLGADKRPGYRQLLDAIASGQCTAVYSYSLSRLGRSLPELARLIEDCDKRGIPVRLDRDSVDTSTASGRLLANVLGSVAAFEADVASERTRAAYAAKAARGERIGSRFYGEKEGEDPAAVLAAFEEAGSFAKAARLLNERGIKPRVSKQGWWPASVAGVVRRLRPMPRHGSRGVRAGPPGFVLSRLMRCPTCGTRLTGSVDGNWSEPRVRYSCSRGSVVPHPRRSVSEHLILNVVKAEVERLRTPQRVRLAEVDKEQRAQLEARRVRILDLFEAGHVDRGDRERRMAMVAAAEAKLDAKNIVAEIPEIDWSWEPGALNGVLRSIFEEIDLDPLTFQPLPDGFHWLVPEWRSARRSGPVVDIRPHRGGRLNRA